MGKHPDQIDSFFAPILKGEEVSLIFINIIFSLNHCVLKLLRTFLQLPQVYGTNIKLFSYCAPFFVNSHAFAIDQDAMTLFHITKMRSNYCVCTKWAPIPIRHFFSRISKVNPSNEFTFLLFLYRQMTILPEFVLAASFERLYQKLNFHLWWGNKRN